MVGLKAQGQLGWIYEKGLGTEKDFKLALEWYKKAADQGDAWAQGQLGWY